MPPTGNWVLNQIPAGDGKESSSEQVMPADGVLLLVWSCVDGAGIPLPPSKTSWVQRQSDLLDPPKNKK